MHYLISFRIQIPVYIFFMISDENNDVRNTFNEWKKKYALKKKKPITLEKNF